MAKKRRVNNKDPASVSTTVYRIQLKGTSQIETEARREFNNLYAVLRYQKTNYYHDLAILMCLSRNDPYTATPVNANKGKRGRPRREYKRHMAYRHTGVKHETDLHIHLYLAGRGSSMVAQRIRKKYGAKQYTDNDYMPYVYVKRQALSGCFRAVDCDPFIDKDHRYELFEWVEQNRFKPGFDEWHVPD